jgi:Protein of unknown function (DUF2795)
MERASSKHGPHLDEEMAHEVRGIVQGGTDSRVEEFHDPEPAGEDQPDPSYVPEGPATPGAPPGMTPEEVDERSNLGRFIPMSSLPGDRERLLAGAREMNAPDEVISQLAKLPPGETFETVSQAWAALGHHNEARRT